MTAALTSASSEYLIPEAAVTQMIAACAYQIREARSIPAIKVVITQAEAIDAVTKKINAAEDVRRAALALMVDAEKQLGEISKGLPQATRGGRKKGETAPTGKRQTLREHGINHLRAYSAEKLSEVPQAALDVAIDSAKSRTVAGVEIALGIRKPWDSPTPKEREYVTPEKRARDLLFLAKEAIEWLEKGIPCPKGNVAEMRNRLQRLSVGA